MHAELLEDVVGVGQHVHQVRDRRALIAGHVGHAGLEQRLGDRENALAAEFSPAPRYSFWTSFVKDRSAMVASSGHGRERVWAYLISKSRD